MKIVFATPTVPPEAGSSSRYAKEFASRAAKEHDVTVIAYASTSEPLESVKFVTASKHRTLPVRLMKYLFILYRESKGADIIYVQNAVAAGLPAMLVGKVRRIPVVLRLVSDEAWERATQRHETTKPLEEFLKNPEGGSYVRLIQAVQRVVVRNVSIVTAPSIYMRTSIVNTYHLDPAKVSVSYDVPLTIETAPFIPESHPHQLFSTNRLVGANRIEDVVRAVHMLKDKLPSLTYLVAGTGPEMLRLKDLVAKLHVEDHVTFLGNVSQAEMLYLLKSSRVYLFVSITEGLSYTAYMSYAAEIPIIAIEGHGMDEVISTGETGLLVPFADPASVAAAIYRIMTDSELAAKLGRGGRRLLEEKFSWDAHLRTLSSIFNALVLEP